APTLRVTLANDPDTVVNLLSLTNILPVVGATVHDGLLYLLQGVSGTDWPYLVQATWDGIPSPFKDYGTNQPPVSLSVYDLAKLPELSLVGQEQAAVTNFNGGFGQAVWPKPGLLVWSGGSANWWPIMGGGIRIGGPEVVGGVVSDIFAPWPWYWGGNGGRLLAFNVENPPIPKFVSEVNLFTNGWWSLSYAYAANGMVYLSHQANEFIEGVVLQGQLPPAPTIEVDPTTGETVTNEPPVGIWTQRYYLDVVDYADPTTPTVRNPVNIPGVLQGISSNGALLYTKAPHWSADWTTDWLDWLDASAYDGVSAHLVDSLQLPKDWPHPLLVFGTNIFIGRPDTSTNNNNTLETWTLSDGGRFVRLGGISLGSAANDLAAFGDLLAAQTSDGTYRLFDAADLPKLRLIGADSISSWIWGDLKHADGALDRGLWLPLGDYGVRTVTLFSPGQTTGKSDPGGAPPPVSSGAGLASPAP
ncbi:MAG: hypothetical protein M1608_06790, partial [Candidatus Omnitrophica bacterium]|nr:hypothetical protein [Candidatus Omnitrophota bacterium]